MKRVSGSQFGRGTGAAILVVLVSCGSSPTEVADAADDTDATTDSGIADVALEPDADVIDDPIADTGNALGAFICPDRSSYFVEGKTSDGRDFHLAGPCDKAGLGAARFGVARGALTQGPGAITISICAAQPGGPKIDASARLTTFNGGSSAATGTWSDGSSPDAADVGLNGNIEVTWVGSIGDTLEGSYSFTSASLTLSGSFRVCHLYDDALGPPPP